MATITLDVSGSPLSAYVAMPTSPGPWRGVVVIHDALGMSQDVRNQADWLASAGFLAAAPDLFDGKNFFQCLRSTIRDFNRGSGPMFDKIESTRQWLIQHDNSAGIAGVIGFCFGGGFALMLAPGHGFSAASVNYGGLPDKADELLKEACPIVASYGAKDRTLKGTAAKLETILTNAGVPHDIKEYPDTDHAFMNDHSQDRIPWYISLISVVFGGGSYNAESAVDSRARILAFFDKYLQ